MMMYIRLINREDIDKYTFKHILDRDRVNRCKIMVDWRVNIEDGVITYVYMKNDIHSIDETSYYERGKQNYGVLKRFTLNKTLDKLLKL